MKKKFDKGEKVFKCGIVKDPDYLYYLDKSCNISRVMMLTEDGRVKRTEPEVVAKTEISERDPNYLYFIDEEGDVSRINMILREKKKRNNKIRKLKASRRKEK
jgi:hypothetical protein